MTVGAEDAENPEEEKVQKAETTTSAHSNDQRSPLDRLRTTMSTHPQGKTPLCDNLRAIRADLESKAAELRAEGKIAVVVIATDGKPTDGDVADVLKTFKGLPVSIVVRLCTDNDKVVSYWNDLDAAEDGLGVDLDVLNDFENEAKEVTQFNSWLNYSPPLHRVRESGACHRVFDVLDERPLDSDELYEFMRLVYGWTNYVGCADPETEWSAFEAEINAGNKIEGKTYHCLHQSAAHWVGVSSLRECYAELRARSLRVEETQGNAVVACAADEDACATCPLCLAEKATELLEDRDVADNSSSIDASDTDLATDLETENETDGTFIGDDTGDEYILPLQRVGEMRVEVDGGEHDDAVNVAAARMVREVTEDAVKDEMHLQQKHAEELAAVQSTLTAQQELLREAIHGRDDLRTQLDAAMAVIAAADAKVFEAPGEGIQANNSCRQRLDDLRNKLDEEHRRAMAAQEVAHMTTLNQLRDEHSAALAAAEAATKTVAAMEKRRRDDLDQRLRVSTAAEMDRRLEEENRREKMEKKNALMVKKLQHSFDSLQEEEVSLQVEKAVLEARLTGLLDMRPASDISRFTVAAEAGHKAGVGAVSAMLDEPASALAAAVVVEKHGQGGKDGGEDGEGGKDSAVASSDSQEVAESKVTAAVITAVMGSLRHTRRAVNRSDDCLIMAVRIQCVYRSHVARQRTGVLRGESGEIEGMSKSERGIKGKGGKEKEDKGKKGNKKAKKENPTPFVGTTRARHRGAPEHTMKTETSDVGALGHWGASPSLPFASNSVNATSTTDFRGKGAVKAEAVEKSEHAFAEKVAGAMVAMMRETSLQCDDRCGALEARWKRDRREHSDALDKLRSLHQKEMAALRDECDKNEFTRVSNAQERGRKESVAQHEEDMQHFRREHALAAAAADVHGADKNAAEVAVREANEAHEAHIQTLSEIHEHTLAAAASKAASAANEANAEAEERARLAAEAAAATAREEAEETFKRQSEEHQKATNDLLELQRAAEAAALVEMAKAAKKQQVEYNDALAAAVADALRDVHDKIVHTRQGKEAQATVEAAKVLAAAEAAAEAEAKDAREKAIAEAAKALAAAELAAESAAKDAREAQQRSEKEYSESLAALKAEMERATAVEVGAGVMAAREADAMRLTQCISLCLTVVHEEYVAAAREAKEAAVVIIRGKDERGGLGMEGKGKAGDTKRPESKQGEHGGGGSAGTHSGRGLGVAHDAMCLTIAGCDGCGGCGKLHAASKEGAEGPLDAFIRSLEHLPLRDMGGGKGRNGKIGDGDGKKGGKTKGRKTKGSGKNKNKNKVGDGDMKIITSNGTTMPLGLLEVEAETRTRVRAQHSAFSAEMAGAIVSVHWETLMNLGGSGGDRGDSGGDSQALVLFDASQHLTRERAIRMAERAMTYTCPGVTRQCTSLRNEEGGERKRERPERVHTSRQDIVNAKEIDRDTERYR